MAYKAAEERWGRFREQRRRESYPSLVTVPEQGGQKSTNRIKPD